MAPCPSVDAAQAQVMVPVAPWLVLTVTEGTGMLGGPVGTALTEGAEKELVPIELVAATSKM